MARKIIFCFLDTSGLIAKNSKNLDPVVVYKIIVDNFLRLMVQNLNCDKKTTLMQNIKHMHRPEKLMKYFNFYLL